jgi:hypothetical protein
MGSANKIGDAEQRQKGSAPPRATTSSGDTAATAPAAGNYAGNPPRSASGGPAGTVSSLNYFTIPGNLSDLDERPHLREGWSALLDQQMDRILRERRESDLKTHSYNPAREARSSTSVVSTKWLAFPNNCTVNAPDDDDNYDKYKEADVRGNQDEHCEWEVVREGGELKSVTFTTEVTEVRKYYPVTF